MEADEDPYEDGYWEHDEFGVGKDLGPAPSRYADPTRVVHFLDGVIRRVAKNELTEIEWVEDEDE